jgi:hypothetical protein
MEGNCEEEGGMGMDTGVYMELGMKKHDHWKTLMAV